MNGKAEKKIRRINFQILRKLVVVAVLMFGFGYALIPIYKKICELTGINVLAASELVEKSSVENTQIDRSRLVTIELDANIQGSWRFRPLVRSVQVHPGEITQVAYEIVNAQGRSASAQAIPSYAPQEAAAFFKKLECFCFKQQSFAPHETRKMPVVFYIDPALPKKITVITLSYTFFEVGLAGQKVN